MNRQAAGLKKLFPKEGAKITGLENLLRYEPVRVEQIEERAKQLVARGVRVTFEEGGLVRLNNYACLCRDAIDTLCVMGGFLMGMDMKRKGGAQ